MLRITLDRRMRNARFLITLPFILILFAGILIWSFATAIDHVEDTNGTEDISIQTITDMDIVNMNYGSRGLTRTEGLTGAKFHSKKFTGISELLYQNYIGSNNTVILDLAEFEVKEGNFVLVVVNEGRILAELTPSDTLSYTFENITGYFSVRAVGESASFVIRMTKQDYNMFFHP